MTVIPTFGHLFLRNQFSGRNDQYKRLLSRLKDKFTERIVQDVFNDLKLEINFPAINNIS